MVKKIYDFKNLPVKEKYEIAIMGRSNVGKSSFLNCILGEKISRVAKKPGCTRWLGFHETSYSVNFVDLPGYGYANMGRQRKNFMVDMARDYLFSGRVDEIFILIDSRRGVMDLDREVIDFCRENNVPFKIVGTKSDKKDSLDFESNFLTSSHTKKGYDKIAKYLRSVSSFT
ncbi:ribosome biogenesis GTP-binding protein YihA/YsxC [Candidatus Nesciobacter abundans]|uniref:Ribosome biogenesis GTP-binding protein YsxC n=1 Tax=Candidatus Nesciobacter abundans TaxID=2601668 RepID=A0A5C0UGH9_9PROT|nr:ribosome biogenesis GTP-binding protein YihA/YsxC [Candidatus Nesciobacter abundans]QEK39178.1 ribosome biogenesis GTP-binding protein YsxC [Candidatus Nesciobacter abundans]